MSSFALGAVDTESRMVTVALEGGKNPTPNFGLKRFTVKVSGPSVYES